MIPTVPVVSLREITEDNRTAVEALAVTEEQSHYVGSVTQSLQEAVEYPDAKAWYRAGYGTAALDLVVEHVRTRPDARTLLTSHVVGPTSPVTFYQRYCFRLTGDLHEGEPILELDLYPS